MIPDTSELISRFHRLQGERDSLILQAEKMRDSIRELESEVHTLEEVEILFQSLLDDEISHSVQVVQNLITEALQAVFQDRAVSVEADVKLERGKVSIQFITKKVQPDGTVIVGDCKESFGGSLLAIQSFILRVFVAMRRGLRPVIFLDESFPAFDANYAANMGDFVASLCKRMGMDILLVTHNPMFFERADLRYWAEPGRDGSAVIKKLGGGDAAGRPDSLPVQAIEVPAS